MISPETFAATTHPAVLSGVDRDVRVATAPEARDRVTVAPPAAWVKMRHIDTAPRAGDDFANLLFDRQHNADTGEDFYRVVQRVENRQALHELGQWSLDFDPATQHVVLHSLAVWRGAEVVEHLDASALRFLQRENRLERLVIDGGVTVMALLGDLRVGDVIDACYTIHSLHRILKERTSVIAGIPLRVPLRSFYFSIRFSRDRNLQWRTGQPSFAPEINRSQSITDWCWSRQNIRPIPPEQRVPSWQDSYSWIQVTDCRLWSEVSAAIAAAWHEDFHDPGLVQLAGEIAASTAVPAGRAQRALEFVQDEIRYLSVNVDLGGQIPASPGVVLQRRYGDCKDKSFLLAHLLRLLQINAQPVLVSTVLSRNVEKWLPGLSLFDHAVVKFEINGQVRWVDSTIPLQGGGVMDRIIPDFGFGLPIGGKVGGLDPIPAQNSRDDIYQLNEKYTLPERAASPVLLAVDITARGEDAEDLRRNFATHGEAEIARHGEKLYKQIYPGVIRTGRLSFEDDRAKNEFTIKETFEIPNGVTESPDGGDYFFKVEAHLVQQALVVPDDAKRIQPLVFPYPRRCMQGIEIVFPSGSGNGTSKIARRSAGLQFSAEMRNVKKKAVITYAVKTLARFIQPAQFEAHLDMVKAVLPETVYQFRYPSPKALATGRKLVRQWQAAHKRRRVGYAWRRLVASLVRLFLVLVVPIGAIVAVISQTDSFRTFSDIIPELKEKFGLVEKKVTKEEVDAAIADLGKQYAELSTRQQTTSKSDPKAAAALKQDIEAYNARNREVTALKERYQAQEKSIETYKTQIIGDWKSTEELGGGITQTVICTYSPDGLLSFDITRQRTQDGGGKVNIGSAMISGRWQIDGSKVTLRRSTSSNSSIASGGGVVSFSIVSLEGNEMVIRNEQGKKVVMYRMP